jgi:hypothetical protein
MQAGQTLVGDPLVWAIAQNAMYPWYIEITGQTHFILPMTLNVKGVKIDTALSDWGMSVATMSRSAVEKSYNFQLATQTLLEIRSEANAHNAKFVMVYAPVREHVYWPYLSRSDQKILLEEFTPGLFDVYKTGELSAWQKVLDVKTIDQFSADIDGQRDAFQDFARKNEIDFLDLTGAMRQVLENGQLPYWFVNEHWNEAGHRAAAATIEQYIKDNAAK